MESGKDKIKVLSDSMSDKGPLPGLQMTHVFLHPHMVKGDPLFSSCTSTHLIHEDLTSCLNYLPKGLSQWGLGLK